MTIGIFGHDRAEASSAPRQRSPRPVRDRTCRPAARATMGGARHRAGAQRRPEMRAEARIAWVERGGDALAIVVGLALRVAAPETSIVTTRPMLLVAAGVVLLAVGLARDVARIALEGRPVVTAPDRHPGELRLCLESDSRPRRGRGGSRLAPRSRERGAAGVGRRPRARAGRGGDARSPHAESGRRPPPGAGPPQRRLLVLRARRAPAVTSGVASVRSRPAAWRPGCSRARPPTGWPRSGRRPRTPRRPR